MRSISNTNVDAHRNYLPENNANTGFVINKIPAIIKPVVPTNSSKEAEGEHYSRKCYYDQIEPYKDNNPLSFSDVPRCLVIPKPKFTIHSMEPNAKGRRRATGGWLSTKAAACSAREKKRSENTICVLPPNTTIKPANVVSSHLESSKIPLQCESAAQEHAVEQLEQLADQQILGVDGAVEDDNSAELIEEAQNAPPMMQTLVQPQLFTGTAGNKPATVFLQSPSMKRPTIMVSRDLPKRTIRTVTLEMIERKPLMHIGVHEKFLPLLKNIICSIADVSLVDLYITLKKLKQNEDFSLIAEYFEMSEQQIQDVFVTTLVRCARFLKYLLSWPNHQSRYERHRNLPFVYRKNLHSIQNVVECVETEMRIPLHVNCNNYKFILTIDTNSKYGLRVI